MLFKLNGGDQMNMKDVRWPQWVCDVLFTYSLRQTWWFPPLPHFSLALQCILLFHRISSQLSKAGCSGILFWYFHIFLFNSNGCYLSCYIFSCCFIFASSHKNAVYVLTWFEVLLFCLLAGCLTLQREQQLSTFIIPEMKSCECVLSPQKRCSYSDGVFSCRCE